MQLNCLIQYQYWPKDVSLARIVFQLPSQIASIYFMINFRDETNLFNLSSRSNGFQINPSLTRINNSLFKLPFADSLCCINYNIYSCYLIFITQDEAQLLTLMGSLHRLRSLLESVSSFPLLSSIFVERLQLELLDSILEIGVFFEADDRKLYSAKF